MPQRICVTAWPLFVMSLAACAQGVPWTSPDASADRLRHQLDGLALQAKSEAGATTSDATADDGTPTGTDTAGSEQRARADRWASAQCAFIARCSHFRPPYDQLGGSIASCRAVFLRAASTDSSFVLESTTDCPEQADVCVAALVRGSCGKADDDGFFLVPLVCECPL